MKLHNKNRTKYFYEMVHQYIHRTRVMFYPEFELSECYIREFYKQTTFVGSLWRFLTDGILLGSLQAKFPHGLKKREVVIMDFTKGVCSIINLIPYVLLESL